MMFYGLHTTKGKERWPLIKKRGEKITVDPAWIHASHHKSIIIEEDTEKTYENPVEAFHELVDNLLKNRNYDPMGSRYVELHSHKLHDIYTRVMNLRDLVLDIQKNGVKIPIHVEKTGERLDGSYRTKIALYLGIKEVPAKLHRFRWQDIDEDFIVRKLAARWLSSGKDYYEFPYGYKDWKNIPEGGEVYRENAERAETIVPLIKGKTVLDMGCNEGYISLQAALKGKQVTGIDTDFTHIAYLNRLVFEWVNKKTLKAEFYEEDLLTSERTADTILLLNVLYHVPKEAQEKVLRRFHGKQLIFQCNLRKKRERENYYTSHPDDLMELLHRVGRVGNLIEWRDKPIVVA